MTAQEEGGFAERAGRALKRSVATAVAEIVPVDPETLRLLERAMHALPRTTREVFLAHRLDGCSYVEIARVTGLSVREVERHITAALLAIMRAADA